MLVGLVAALAYVTCVAAQGDTGSGRAIEARLLQMVERLRLGLSIASVAVYSPTIADIRWHSQQLVNVLEGIHGVHYVRPGVPDDAPGLLPEIAAVAASFDKSPFEPELRLRLATATKNVRVFLDLALASALSALVQRRLDSAVQDMMRVYAFLSAVYEKPCDTAYVPALWTLLRAFGLTEAAAA